MSRRNPFMDEIQTEAATYDHVEWLFDQIYDWIEREQPAHFDPYFVDSLKEFYDDKGFLSDRQEQSLQKIFDKWVDN